MGVCVINEGDPYYMVRALMRYPCYQALYVVGATYARRSVDSTGIIRSSKMCRELVINY